jgi:hypothetical protein
MNENKLTKAYNVFMEYMYEATDDTIHTIADKLNSAKEKTSEIGGLTQDEINHVADAVSRDVHHAAHTLPDNSNDSLSEWFKFDIELLENFALDSFLDVADKLCTDKSICATFRTFRNNAGRFKRDDFSAFLTA